MKQPMPGAAGRGWWALALVSLIGATLLVPSRLSSFIPASATAYRELLAQGILLVRLGLVGVAVLAALSALLWRHKPSGSAAEGKVRLSGRDWLFAFALLVLAAALRWPCLSSSLWWDEMTTMVRVVQRGFPFVLVFVAEGTSHLCNTLLVWFATLLFGQGEIQIRFPAFLLGALTPTVFYLCMTHWARRSLAGIIAFLAAVNFTLILHSTEARGYAGSILFSFLSCVLFAEVLRRPARGSTAGYIACSLLAAGFLVFSVIVPFSHGLLALSRLVRQGRARVSENLDVVFPCLWVGALALLFFGFHLPQMAEYGLHRSSVDHLLARDAAPEIGRYLAGGSLFALFGILGGVGLVAASREQRALVLSAGMPLFMGIVWLLVPGARFSPRFFFFAVPCLLIGITFCLDAIARRSPLIQATVGTCLAFALVSTQFTDYERLVRVGNPNLKDLSSRLASSRVLLAGMQSDVNVYYFQTASRMGPRTPVGEADVLLRKADYVVDGVNWYVNNDERISQHGFMLVERLDSWTKNLPSFLVYQRVKPGK